MYVSTDKQLGVHLRNTKADDEGKCEAASKKNKAREWKEKEEG